MKNLKTIILAAGKGTRMNSDKAKVLHETAGRTLLDHVLTSVNDAGSEEIAVIVGNQKEDVIKQLPSEVEYFVQEEQNGTGHAVMQARDFFNNDEESVVLVLNSDTPLIKPETIKNLIQNHIDSKNQATVLTTVVSDPFGFGRIVRDGDELVKIVEEKDANSKEKEIQEVNSGIYCFNASELNKALDQITSDNNQKELYLTDTIEIIKNADKKVGTFRIEDNQEIINVNSRIELSIVDRIFRKEINEALMNSGVTIIDPENTYIDVTVEIGKDTIIYPGCYIEGETSIGKNCVIGLNSHITNSVIKNNVSVESSTIIDSVIDDNTTVGPYAYLRPNSNIGKHVKIGDFVEVKNSVIKDGAKASHLTYIGDAEVGKNVNLGCGTVFVNYDGKKKHKTIVEDNCFIGCNTNLVAPVTIKEGSYTAAGSTITDDVPENSLAIARNYQENKIDYFVDIKE